MKEPIVFFDDECSLCNRLVQFVIKRGNLHVAPLQSDTAKTVLNQNYTRVLALNTLVLFENNTIFIKSDAVLQIFKRMPAPWPLLNLFGKAVPLFMRNKLYDIVASNRLKWFKQKGNCSVTPNF